MYRSMAELATHCRRVRPQWVTVTVALLRNGLTIYRCTSPEGGTVNRSMVS